MGNKQHAASIVSPREALTLLTASSVESLRRHFASVIGTSGEGALPICITKAAFQHHLSAFLHPESWSQDMLGRLFDVARAMRAGPNSAENKGRSVGIGGRGNIGAGRRSSAKSIHSAQSSDGSRRSSSRDSRSSDITINSHHTNNSDGDTNNNDSEVIYFEEYAVCMFILGTPGTRAQKLELLFHIYDTDAGGAISKKNMTKILSRSAGLGPNAPSSWEVDVTASRIEKLSKSNLAPIFDLAVATVMAAYDVNGDGKLDFSEWCRFAEDSIEIGLMLDRVAHPLQKGAPWDELEVKGVED